MATRFFRKKVILSKIEAVYGTDPVPTGAANAIAIRNAAFDFTPLNISYVDRDIVRHTLGHDVQLVAASEVNLRCEVELAGSGVAGTPPAWGPLLRACAMAQTTLGAAHTQTATAGAASTITLHGTASAVDNAYRGMRIRTTGGTGSGQARIIASYVGGTKVATVSEAWTTPPDATTVYSIDAQVAYLPVSSAMESITNYINMDGKRHIMTGVRGSWGVRLDPGNIPAITLDLMGLFLTPTDTVLPTQVLTAWPTPEIVNYVNTSVPSLHGFAATKLYGLSVAMNNQVIHRDLPGVEDIMIPNRGPTGSIEIEDPTIAEKNYFTSARSVTLGALSVLHGSAAGKQVHIHAPAVQLTQPRYSDRNSIIGLQMQTRFTPQAGDDEVSLQVL
jgi:hypothetical protein